MYAYGNDQTLDDTSTMCYRSYILRMPAFDYPEADAKKIYMQSKIYLAEENYGYGKFVGTD